MTRSIQESCCKESPILKGVLDQWIEINNKCATEWDGGLPWGHGERSVLSLLAGAIWKCGGIAFEEFKEKKLNSQDKRQRYRGRIDLYFKLNGKEYLVESKYHWCNFPDPKLDKKLSRYLDSAYNDAERSRPWPVDHRLGVLFIVPSIKSRASIDTTKRIKEFIEVVKNIKCSCMAWIFPNCTRKSAYAQRHFRRQPGIAILIQEVK